MSVNVDFKIHALNGKDASDILQYLGSRGVSGSVLEDAEKALGGQVKNHEKTLLSTAVTSVISNVAEKITEKISSISSMFKPKTAEERMASVELITPKDINVELPKDIKSFISDDLAKLAAQHAELHKYAKLANKPVSTTVESTKKYDQRTAGEHTLNT